MKNRYYVYIYLDPRKPGKYYYPGIETTFLFEPFYVGKGSKYRLNKHLNSVQAGSKHVFNSFKVGKIKHILKEGLMPHIMIFTDNLSEKDAFNLEKDTIKIIGRNDLNDGPLCNFTNGGEGSSGRQLSEETKNKIRLKRLGQKASEKTKEKMRLNNSGKNNPMYGKISAMKDKKHSDESIKKMKKPKPDGFNQHLKNKKMPESTKLKIGNANKGILAKPVDIYDINWNLLKKCETTTEAGKYSGIDGKMVLKLLKTGEPSKKRGFRFKYSIL